MVSGVGWKWHTGGIKLSASQLSAHANKWIIRVDSFLLCTTRGREGEGELSMYDCSPLTIKFQRIRQ
jgi:hypothetical protein